MGDWRQWWYPSYSVLCLATQSTSSKQLFVQPIMYASSGCVWVYGCVGVQTL